MGIRQPFTLIAGLCALLAAAVGPFLRAAPVEGAARTVPPRALATDRLEKISRAYLGTRYQLDCLGEARGPDPDPLFTRDAVDCQTLVEQVMAEAVAPWEGGLDAAVRLVRYHHSDVRLENRYHYCIPDWLENPWPVTDITAAVAGRTERSVSRRIDRPAFLASRGGDPTLSPAPPELVHEVYIPRSQVAGVERRIPSGAIAVFVLGKPGIVSGHLGFLFRKNGVLVLRHASQTRHKVIDLRLDDFLARAPQKFIGMKVLRPDVAGLQR